MKIAIGFLVLLGSLQIAVGQGCSDAGFCTMESFQSNLQDTSTSNLKNTIKVGQSVGLGAKNTLAYASYIDYGRNLGNAFKFNLKLTSLLQQGKGVTAFGVSDAFISSTVKLNDHFSFTAGTKIPLNNADNSQNGLPLPMDFQPSLGTVDGIVGLNYNLNGIKISTAIQQPMTQNKNAFLAELYPENHELREFQSTRNFHRYADVLVSVSKPLKLNRQWIFTPNLLPIYHIQNDTYENLQNEIVEIDGSKGLTFNINLYLDYRINDQNLIQINAGAPIIARKSRPEGLTRSAIINVEYSYLF